MNEQSVRDFYKSYEQKKDQVLTLDHPVAKKAGVKLELVRMDQNHPEISGNKLWKLKYNLLEAAKIGAKRIITFGGAYSNHIHAMAAAGRLLDFETVGIIRGEAPHQLNPTLQDATNWGMELHHISRTEYRNRHEESFQNMLCQQFSADYIVPEGGSNALALRGIRDWVDKFENCDTYCVATGSGGTAAGILTGMKAQKLLSFPVLKGGLYLKDVIEKMVISSGLSSKGELYIIDSYHFGGFAKFNNDLINFINAFQEKYKIPLEPLYTAKLLYGVLEMTQSGSFQKGEVVRIVHTGGLQGIRGFNQRFRDIIHIS